MFDNFVALATDGIFRRSASTVLVKESQERVNRGEKIDFKGDFHLAAVLIKAFLREMPEPLLTFEIFDEIIEFQSMFLLLKKLYLRNRHVNQCWFFYYYPCTTFFFTELSKDERGPFVKQIVLEKLPEDNYCVLKYLVQFLAKVLSKQ